MSVRINYRNNGYDIHKSLCGSKRQEEFRKHLVFLIFNIQALYLISLVFFIIIILMIKHLYLVGYSS